MKEEFSRETVKRIAELARLYLTEEEVSVYQEELAKIMDAFKALSQLRLPEDFAGDARSALVMTKAVANDNDDSMSRLRSDGINNELSSQTFLSQAPEREGVFIRVPAILAPST
jgi:aspartyl-tRNA(Asn)/glutamyl-tRNA(Gln) amidotransferase subunit C